MCLVCRSRQLDFIHHSACPRNACPRESPLSTTCLPSRVLFVYHPRPRSRS
jgi:hypothetical protein